MGKKLTYKFVKTSFEDAGYRLNTVYINSRQKLEYICSVGHTGSMTWKNWYQGNKCSVCANVRRVLEYNKVKESFVKEGYKLLSKEYKGSHTKLEFLCPRGHKGEIRWADWQSRSKCKQCHFENRRVDIEHIKCEINKENYILLDTNYGGNKVKLKCRCDIGHEFYTTWNVWSRGCRCPTCATISKTGSGSSLWKGGISCEPYCPIWQDKEYKEDIKLRDGYKCLNPCCDSKNPNDLTIHHIDYNKKNCVPNNLITLCRSCNSRANTDRKWHTAWYQAIMLRRAYITL